MDIKLLKVQMMIPEKKWDGGNIYLPRIKKCILYGKEDQNVPKRPRHAKKMYKLLICLPL